MENFEDENIACKDCGASFVWSAEDKKFLQECMENQTPNPFNGSVIKEVMPPKRCYECRAKRKKYFEELKSKK